MTTKNNKVCKPENIEKEIASVKNPFQMILIILSHPIFYIPTLIILIVILGFATIKFTYKDGHFIWEKKSLQINRTLDKMKKIEDAIKQ